MLKGGFTKTWSCMGNFLSEEEVHIANFEFQIMEIIPVKSVTKIIKLPNIDTSIILITTLKTEILYNSGEKCDINTEYQGNTFMGTIPKLGSIYSFAKIYLPCREHEPHNKCGLKI